MKIWHKIALAVLGILVIYLVFEHRYEWGLARPPGDGSGQDAIAGLDASVARPARVTWQQLDRAPDGFKAEMPSDFKQIQIPAFNEQGGQDQVNMIYANPDAETTYSLAWEDNPPVARASGQVADKILDMARDNALTKSQTTMVNEARTNPGGFPGRDFSARNQGGGVMNCRLVYASPRLYMLTASFPSASARSDRDVARFFNSFKPATPSAIPALLPSATVK